jgi:hypothetical protein
MELESSFHEAGYDAFITSKVFATLYNNIIEEEKENTKNLLFSFKSIYVINLAGEDK